MHHQLEIVMPPTDDVERQVKNILAQFEEGEKDEDGFPNSHAFWDWYVIGGRWSGYKLEVMLGEDNIQDFRKLLNEMDVKVSGLQAGKPELVSHSQQEIDELWNEKFPNSPVKQCPLFNYYNDQYSKNECKYGDIMRLGDMPKEMSSGHVIVAGPEFESEKPFRAGDNFKAEVMLEKKYWNGVNYNDTNFDGLVWTAINKRIDGLSNAQDNYKEVRIPSDGWLVVTVDYHS